MLWKIAIGNPPSGVSINFYEMPEALVSDPTTYLYGIQKNLYDYFVFLLLQQ